MKVNGIYQPMLEMAKANKFGQMAHSTKGIGDLIKLTVEAD